MPNTPLCMANHGCDHPVRRVARIATIPPVGYQPLYYCSVRCSKQMQTPGMNGVLGALKRSGYHCEVQQSHGPGDLAYIELLDCGHVRGRVMLTEEGFFWHGLTENYGPPIPPTQLFRYYESWTMPSFAESDLGKFVDALDMKRIRH